MNEEQKATYPAYVPPAYVPPAYVPPPAPAEQAPEAPEPYAPPAPAAPAPAYSAPAVPEPAAAVPDVPAPGKRKGFPVFGIPAIVMLAALLALFGFELFLSFHRVNILKIAASKPMEFRNYEALLSYRTFPESLLTTPWFKFIQLAAGALPAAGLCALYYAMEKPRTVLTFACLWLIPACLPYMTTALLSRGTLRADYSGTLLYMLASVCQTASLFCFFGGLFTFLNLQKKGRTGGGPYYGMLVGALVFLLGMMTADAVAPAMYSPIMSGRSMDFNIFRFLTNNDLGRSAAGSVLKVLLQFAAGILPLTVLCILARRKSMKGKTPLAVLWVFLAVPTGIPFLLLGSSIGTGDRILSSVFISIALVLIGGGFSGLIAYSFVHLMRRVPSLLFGIIAVALTAAMSWVTSRYILYCTGLGLYNTIWPQVFSAAFDGRLVWIIIVLSFALRDYRETRPASLVIAIALLTGALLWGEISVAYLYYNGTGPVSYLLMQVMNSSRVRIEDISVSSEQYSAMLASTVTARSIQNWLQVLLAAPPLLLGTGAALLLKRALATPKLRRG